eukprot:4829234-Pyramimonas_sp.AAC.1
MTPRRKSRKLGATLQGADSDIPLSRMGAPHRIPQGHLKFQAVAKRPGVLIGPPNNVLTTVCGFYDMFLEHVWLGLSCSGLSEWTVGPC